MHIFICCVHRNVENPTKKKKIIFLLKFLKYAFGILKDNKNAWIFSLRKSYIIRREKLLKCTRNFYWIVSYNWNRSRDICNSLPPDTKRILNLISIRQKERAANFLCQKNFYSFGSLYWNEIRGGCMMVGLTFSTVDWCTYANWKFVGCIFERTIQIFRFLLQLNNLISFTIFRNRYYCLHGYGGT